MLIIFSVTDSDGEIEGVIVGYQGSISFDINFFPEFQPKNWFKV